MRRDSDGSELWIGGGGEAERGEPVYGPKDQVALTQMAALGLGGMKESKAVAADVARLVLGDKGALLIALIVCLAAVAWIFRTGYRLKT